MNNDLTILTPGERLWLWRRRQPSPTGRRTGRGGNWMSANEAAAALTALSVKVYCDAERDEDEDAAEEFNGEMYARYGVLDITPGDLCLVARRRAGTPLAEVCRELGGVSKPTFNRMEREGHPDVVDLWKKRGFIFE